MEIQKDNIIDIRNIRSLSGLKFLIPDYQRGYKWTRTQAKQMLDDFHEFIQAGESDSKVEEWILLSSAGRSEASYMDGF